MWALLGQSFSVVFNPVTLLYICVGTIVGVVMGAMPGISASMAVVIAMTFSYALDPLPAIALLVAVYCAAITGGGISAILFSIPGTPSSATTTFDGYPMAQRGEGGKALGVMLITSAIGGIISCIALLMLTQPLASVALKFGPSELFAVAFLGLSILVTLDKGNVVRTVASGLIGLWLACIGIDPIKGDIRFTFGSPLLAAGIELIPVMIGLFAAVEVFKQLSRKKAKKAEMVSGSVSTKLMSFKELWEMKITILRSSILGTVIGILPGAGATIAAFLSYAIEVRSSKNPETYGKGNPRGVAASEAANNAATGGAMVPLLALGIPGGNAAAIMATALAIKGVNMGPLLLATKPIYLYTVFTSMFFTNIFMVIVAIGIAKVFAKVLSIPYSMLGTIIIMLCFLGSYSNGRSITDIYILVIAGVIGYLFNRAHFNSAALILGLVLGPMVEKNLRNAIILAKGNLYQVFIAKPITLVLMIAIILMLVFPLVKPFFMKLFKKEKVA